MDTVEEGLRPMVTREHLTVDSQLTLLSHIQEWFRGIYPSLEQQAPWLKTPRDRHDRLMLALTEGFTNAVRHAHSGLPTDTAIAIDCALWNDHIEIRIWDQGQPFDPETLVEPKPGSLIESGYGWFLLRRCADEVTYERGEDGRNCLVIVQYAS